MGLCVNKIKWLFLCQGIKQWPYVYCVMSGCSLYQGYKVVAFCVKCHDRVMTSCIRGIKRWTSVLGVYIDDFLSSV